jgi:P-type Mg2+ transporter
MTLDFDSYFRYFSKPEKYLLAATLVTIGASIIIHCTPVATLLGFQPLPLSLVLALGAIVATYVVTADLVKKIFYQYVKF